VRFAVIADVHGNRLALEAVLEDIARRGIREIVNAGDHLFGPLDPTGTADLLMRLNLPSVAGNQDRELIELAEAAPAGSTLEQNRQALSPRHRDWLLAMPRCLELPGGILMFHGTPTRDDVYLLETVHENGGVSLATPEEIAARLGVVPQKLLLCGHTHIPRAVAHAGQLIVNPGSVGLQAYADDQPVPHVMETGSPHARYAILEMCESGWRAEHIAVPYDAESAARTAERNGRPDWARRLRTGRAA
jgi:predicted phosphodiesterase